MGQPFRQRCERRAVSGESFGAAEPLGSQKAALASAKTRLLVSYSR